MDSPRRAVPVLGRKVTLIRTEVCNDCRGGSEPPFQLLERVVVDQIELDIFVTAALTRSRICLTEQVQCRSLLCLMLRRALRLRRVALACGVRRINRSFRR